MRFARARRRQQQFKRRQENQITSKDPDPFEQGRRAARENIPAEGNLYSDGSKEHALWMAGHEQVASVLEAGEGEGT